jgi:quercetin dioxygenase-like cupin family protein
MERLRLACWQDSWEEVYPGVRRWVTSGEFMTVTFYEFDPGSRFPLHAHDQEQAVVVTRGALTFSTGEEEETVVPNAVLWIPPGVPHEAVAGPEGASVVSVVSPARHSGEDLQILGA